MATPINVSEDSTIYIVDITMGSQFQGRSWDLDDYNRQTEYKNDKKTRRDIGAIRQHVNVIKNDVCMKYGRGKRKICFTNYEGMLKITEACTDADRKMKAIDPSLSCYPEFFEQTFRQINSQNMFTLMQQQLNEQINRRVLDRIEKQINDSVLPDGTHKKITDKTRQALTKMIENLKDINILQDENVNNRIEELKARIAADSLTDIRDEIMGYIQEIQGETTLEITPDDVGESTPAKPLKGVKPDRDKDEEAYKPRAVTPVPASDVSMEGMI